jgi:hypothetical protein
MNRNFLFGEICDIATEKFPLKTQMIVGNETFLSIYFLWYEGTYFS